MAATGQPGVSARPVNEECNRDKPSTAVNLKQDDERKRNEEFMCDIET
jgi:hypothetical protein